MSARQWIKRQWKNFENSMLILGTIWFGPDWLCYVLGITREEFDKRVCETD